ncbi:COQ9 family protein [Gimibacter soli]|uniref:COQ9 family protein n=1 Tax=Gimibacter soli TaxID=3024400 RepID=A0AAF0BM39_9PROT|nr:COQ9 family protein [Gimibacter soli]WCL54001.1 COQ9 family protein [Gimibacter soli]
MAKADLTPEELRKPLLDAMLAHVPFDGWSDKALKAAAEDAGVSAGIAELAFPRGAIEALEMHLADADARMAAAIAELDLPAMKIRDRVTAAIRIRLDQAEGHREAVRRGLATLALPTHAGLGAKALWNTADTIWRSLGDTSTDHNWYTKRMTLSAVYSAVLLYWLSDESEGYTDTHAFLDRRIEGVMKIEKAKWEFRKAKENMPSIARFLGRLRYPGRAA